ncbi:MAG: ABC transporter ATP-binding protein [Bacteroidetes bacterium]|nr:ABC transporter ATP-binding protein [Bacteroidota bacterium]MBP7398414.1 ABC transporter ATP-binding protein [Chitinophagales bacterium]MBK7108832.1 ABC transporter ATP-binding protein [Bacteroidota bacterium]MBK8488840.1 ABC transporter ATP-binding protein [Bacteroidota bacterium]MBK8680692.1 ABC transporter ATP-binding protein [Bacteroidota bacterium]
MPIKISNLSKTYKNGVKALDNINLTFNRGMIGLLGPNGAGKSSLMRTIATLQTPDSGNILFDEIDILKTPMELRKVLGYLPQEFGVYPKVTAEELLDYFAILKGITSKSERNKIIQYVLEITNLTEVRMKHVANFSGGMKQRFGIAQLLLNNPRLIIVDEPTAGLDPAERNRFLNVLREVGTDNTVIFSTHIVEDIKDLCQNICIMKKGKVLNFTTPAKAIQEINGSIWVKKIAREQLQNEELKRQILSSKYNADNSITIKVFAENEPDDEWKSIEPQLEDVYFISLNNN